MVIWLTGISGAGKSTIADVVMRVAKPKLPSLVLIDGDVIRDLFGAGLGYHEDARKEQIRRIQRLAMFLSRQRIPVLVAALYSNPELMRWNREHLPNYFEVYVDTPLDVVKMRNTKGLYAKAKDSATPNVVGIDIPWHAPRNPDLVVQTVGASPESIAREIIAAAPALSSLDITNIN
jgi:adenylylsulfate kinase